MHSTAAMAGAFAARLRARRLVLTHFSGRYKTSGAARIAGAVEETNSNTQVTLCRNVSFQGRDLGAVCTAAARCWEGLVWWQWACVCRVPREQGASIWLRLLHVVRPGIPGAPGAGGDGCAAQLPPDWRRQGLP